MMLDPCLQYTASAGRERSSAIERVLLRARCDGREAREQVSRLSPQTQSRVLRFDHDIHVATSQAW